MSMDDLKYCLCCGEEVPVNVVVRSGWRELTCIYCGFTLEAIRVDEPLTTKVSQSSEPAVDNGAVSVASTIVAEAIDAGIHLCVKPPQPPAGSTPAPQKIPKEGYALIADDSRYTRMLIEALLKEKNYSTHIMAFENGLELISAYSKLLTENKSMDIAIIDLNMPVMDGLTAARMIRALETKGKTHAVPIVFFSAEKCGQDLKQQMENMQPANYVNKGSDPDPDKLTQRIEFLLAYLSETYKENPA